MTNFSEVFYGMPRLGGPDQLPPEMVWRPGFGTLPGEGPMDFPFEIPTAELKPQILVEDGVLAKLGTDGELSGSIDAKMAADVKLTLDAEAVNGIYITGDSSYEIKNADLNLSGDCINDFAGNGAAVQVMKNAKTVISDSRIRTKGVLRSCIVADEFSTLEVNDCELICEGGTPAPDHPAWMIPAGPGMIKAPDVMQCEGHSRLALTVGNAHAYYNNCRIVSDGWAALSTDASWGDTYLEANHCDITLKHAGYATFSDEGAQVVFNDCNVETPHISAMICGKAAVAYNECRVNAGKNGVWMFAIQGANGSQIANLKVNKSKIDSKEAVFLVSGTNAHIEVRGSQLRSESGEILYTKDNKEDPMGTKVTPGEPLYGIKAIFEDMDLEGDIIHNDPDRAMAVCINHTKCRGAIRNATVQFDPASKWFATGNSSLRVLGKLELSQIDAPEHVTIEMECESMEKTEGIRLASGGTLVIR